MIRQNPIVNELEPQLRKVSALSRDQLIGIAVARGCHHYAPFVAPHLVVDEPELSHEVLGCALLRGPTDLDTFHSVRVGAMVLSDESCSPAVVNAAAEAMGVRERLAHIAQVALAAGERPDYWMEILAGNPTRLSDDESDFLPGISRFTVETGKSGPGRGPVRVWLRTHYAK
jgi:hypothetical protein